MVWLTELRRHVNDSSGNIVGEKPSELFKAVCLAPATRYDNIDGPIRTHHSLKVIHKLKRAVDSIYTMEHAIKIQKK